MSNFRSTNSNTVPRTKTQEEKELANELLILNQQISDSIKYQKEIESNIVDLKEEIGVLELGLTQRQISFKNLEKSLDEISNDFSLSSNDLNKLNKKKEDTVNEIELLEERYKNKTEQLKTDFQTNFNNTSKDLDKVNTQLSKAREDLSDIQKSIIDLSQSKNILDKNYQDKTTEYEELLTYLKSVNKEKEILDSVISSNTSVKEELYNDIESLDFAINEKNKEINDLDLSIKILNENNELLSESNKIELQKIDEEKFALATRESVLLKQTVFIKNKYLKAGVAWDE